ncbi:MAG: SpoIIE family protein phosphatase [Alphaproteobacteria bacterium]
MAVAAPLRFKTMLGAGALAVEHYQPLRQQLTDPLIPHAPSVFIGRSRMDFLAGLEQGHRGILLGKEPHKLLPLLKSPLPDAGTLLLAVVGESRLLYNNLTAKAMADFLGHTLGKRITTAMLANVRVVVQEALTNAVEHGNLNMQSHGRVADWRTAYYADIKHRLTTADGAQPVALFFTTTNDALHGWVEDVGQGFCPENLDTAAMATPPFGHGLTLCRMLAQNIEHDKGGRRFHFSLALLPAAPQGHHTINLAHARAHGRVLVVDDQDINRELVRHYLHTAGYQHISTASNGMMALDKMLTDRPDVVLMDVLMPQMDGFAAMQAMKANPDTAHIPVLFLSALTDAENRTTGYQLGAVDYVNKPLDAAELVARTDTHMMNGMMLRHQQQIAHDLNDELEEARHFQNRLFPTDDQLRKLEQRHNVKLSRHYRPTERLAGDYWQVWDVDTDTLGFVMVDFSGHGTLAALHTVQLHALILELRMEAHDPETFALALNDRLCALMKRGSFATCLYGTLDTSSGHVETIGCGAPPLVVVPAQAQHPITTLEQAGLPLGMVEYPEKHQFTTQCIQLQPGDTLFLYSDALSEAAHTDGTRWDDAGVTRAIETLRQRPEDPSRLLSNVVRLFDQTAQQPLRDDLTLLSITYQP